MRRDKNRPRQNSGLKHPSRCAQRFCLSLCAYTMLAAPPMAMATPPEELTDRLAAQNAEPLLELYFDEEQLVEVATRAPKPVSQIAENVTIITAKEIEAMNAHSVTEVLDRVAGIFVNFDGRDYAGPSSLYIHGSDYEHVLVLVDGFRWTYINGDFSEVNSIPVGIIQRLEVIKGAASSTWGSALGGVINIITKEAGSTPVPTGTISGSYGKAESHTYSGEAAGRLGPLGYYLYADRRHSDGLTDDARYFTDQALYSKFSLALPATIRLNCTVGSTTPEYKYGYDSAYDLALLADEDDFFYTLGLDAKPASGLNLNVSLFNFENQFRTFGREESSGDLWWDETNDAQTRGGSARLVWNPADSGHTVVVGAEFERRENDDSENLGGYQAPTISENNNAYYLNDTILLGKLSLVPGLRYDQLDYSDDQLSPSLGVTYGLGDATLLRGTVSRGFRKTNMSRKFGDPEFYYFTLNPELEAETVITYQAGLETTLVPSVRLKATLFRHEVKHLWHWDSDLVMYVNQGSARRQGVEVEVRTADWHDLSLGVNGTSVRITQDDKSPIDLYNAKLTLNYDNPRFLRAQLFGRYIYWNEKFHNFETVSNRIIWDLNLAREIWNRAQLRAELFSTGHNLTNSGQTYDKVVFDNAGRWVEAGLRVRF